MMPLGKLIAVLIPTLCIFCVFADLRPGLNPFFREVFGNGEYLLDVYYSTNPRGPMFREPQSLNFRGFLVRGDEQVEVSGRRVDWNGERLYLFDSQFGKFQGRLAKASQGCEPALHFKLGEERPKQGILRAGFCP